MNIKPYIELLKLRIGMMIALTAMLGYALLADDVSLLHLLALGLAMVLGSAAGGIFNHFYDRDIDRQMPRTAGRPLASGLIEDPRGALWLAAALMLTGCAVAALVFNWVVALHLFLGVFCYAIVYTVWLKRRHWVNIVIGGAAGSFALLAGSAAVDTGVWLLPVVMAVFLFLWTPSHFWALAILLKDDYARAGVPMLPVVKGEQTTARWIFINTVLLVATSLLPVAMGDLGKIYGVLAALLGFRFLWLNWLLIKSPDAAMARRNFLFSMLYLMGVFVAVLIDRHLPL